MFYELRMYRAVPGRVGDIASRMATLTPPVFDKHGFGPRLGEWVCTAGAMMPLYVWILRWDSQDQRSAAYAGIYGDPDWNRIREETNAGREMVLGMDVYMLDQTKAGEAARTLHGDRSGRAGGVHELRMIDVHPGRGGQAQDTLVNVDLPALKAAGGTTLGVFNVTIGRNMASLAWFTSWEDDAARTRGWAAHEKDARVVNARAAEVAELKTHVLGRYDSWLLAPTAHNGPRFGFAEK